MILEDLKRRWGGLWMKGGGVGWGLDICFEVLLLYNYFI